MKTILHQLNISFRQRITAIFFVCCLQIISSSALANPEIEVMHWWYRGGEARAIQVLKDEFEQRGGTWFDVSGEDSVKILNTAVSRMAKGYAPTLIQWNSGWEVSQIRNLGLLNSLDLQTVKKLENAFIDSVMDMVMVNGEIVAIPVNVHSENWMWYKPDNFSENITDVMASWDSFLVFAENMSKQGEIALAVGSEAWQHRILFNNVLLGVAGQDLFQEIYNNLNVSVLSHLDFRDAVRTFRKIRNYSHSFGDGRWDQQLAAVAANKALAVSMGDWAKGEFRNLGLKLGRNYDCIPAPGTSDSIILVIDVFALGQVTNPDEILGQKLFLDVATDQAVSETFNYLKGSLSPLRKTDVNNLDKCNRIAYQTLNKRGKAIQPHASIGDRGFLARIDHQITSLWTTDIGIEDWIFEFKSLLLEEHTRRNSYDQIIENQ